MESKIRVIELFAGVGGFRLGLEGWRGSSASSQYTEALEPNYEIVWSNQWEPATKIQHASMVYENRFGKDNHSNEDITKVDVGSIPDHDLLTGGFPCQDYSVASTLKNAKGLIGKKGVLWWSIHKILSEKQNKPKYLFLENVDRLLISPAKQRGRDFAIMLKSLDRLGYAVEWRVINAADYGMPQRRRRVFILGYHKDSEVYDELLSTKPLEWIMEEGTLAKSFPISLKKHAAPFELELPENIVEISDKFNKGSKFRPFENTGLMINGKVTTVKTKAQYEGMFTTMGDLIIEENVDESFYISEDDLPKWKYLKGSKKEVRKNASGFEYYYTEGSMIFPDSLDKASRTIVTGEGGKSASRFKHVIQTSKGLRRLTPIELERLNMFPDNFTELDGVSDVRRAFFMGNALVVGVIEKIGITLAEKVKSAVTV